MNSRFVAVTRAVIAVLVSGLLGTPNLRSQSPPTFTVTQNTNALALAQSIVGTGVTIVGTPQLTGAPDQSGLFDNFSTGPFTNPVTNASGNVSIPKGVILSSGKVADATGSYRAGGADSALGGAGDAGLTAISGFDTNDAVSLQFSFIPNADEIFIEYLFASTEYPEYVNSSYNDVFAFFVNGTNVAVVPGTNSPVTINNVNAGNPVGTGVNNAQYFTQYSTQATPFNYGGATVLLTARAKVNKGVVNTFRFAIADASDSELDSAVLIGTGKLSTTPPPTAPAITTTALTDGQLQVPYSRNLSVSGGTPPYTWSISSGSLPPGLTLSPTGVIQGTPTAAGTYYFVARVTDSGNATSTRSLAIRILGPGPVITTEALPAGSALAHYTYQLTASGGTPPYRWAISSGSLPEGFSFSPTGAIVGTPASPLSSTFEVRLSDSTGLITTKTFTLDIASPVQVARPLEISTAILPEAVVGRLYAMTFMARNSSSHLNWAFSGLPSGFQANSSGEIMGTPTRPGNFTFQVEVSDDSGARASGAFTLIVRPAIITITTERISETRVGNLHTTDFTASGGIPPYAFTLAAGSLPPGLTLSANGRLSGTPAEVGDYQFTVQAMDASGEKGTRSFGIVVRPPVLLVTTPSLVNAVLGGAYSTMVEALGGTKPYTWTATGLPDGLTLNPATGALTGTPTKTGAFTVTIRVVDKDGESASKGYQVNVITQVIITSSLGSMIEGTPVSVALAATGGRAPYTWTVTSGSLPVGLTLNSQGLLSGTPTSLGDSNFTIQSQDADNVSGTKAFAVRVLAPIVVTTDSTPPARFATAYAAGLEATGGVGPYTWSVVGGELPAGLALDATGNLTGAPTSAGSFTFSAQVKDSGIPQQTTQRTFSIQVQLPDVSGVNINIPANPQAGQQARVGLDIGSPYPVDVSGTLNLTFAPNAANNADDPAIQFSTGGRSVPFTISAGQTQAVFRVADLGVQTGTTAGTITLAATLQAAGGSVNCSCPLNQTIVIPRAAPVISGVRATRTASGFSVTISGFSTTREVTQGLFRFAGGAALQTTELTVPLASTFGTYFQGSTSSQFGGQFLLTIPFTVQGETGTVNSVTVTLTNGTGNSQPVTASF